MNNLQQRAVARALRAIKGHMFDGSHVTAEEVRERDGIVSVHVEINMGEPGTLLHALSNEYWLVFVGPRGKLTVKMAPKSCDQFNGRRAFGMLFAHKSF